MKNKKTRARYDSIIVTTGGDTDHIAVRVSDDGKICFDNALSDAYLQKTYERIEKPEKVIYQLSQECSGTFAFDINYNLPETEHLFAVDTNSDCINGRNVSVVAFVQMERVFFVNSSGLAKAFHLFKDMHCVECYDVDPPKENFGWHYALRYISEELRINKNISIVVDADLGNLPQYNSRRRPFYRKLYLPDGVKLIYASSESDRDNIVNAAIACADRAASAVEHALERGHPPQDGRLWGFR